MNKNKNKNIIILAFITFLLLIFGYLYNNYEYFTIGGPMGRKFRKRKAHDLRDFQRERAVGQGKMSREDADMGEVSYKKGKYEKILRKNGYSSEGINYILSSGQLPRSVTDPVITGARQEFMDASQVYEQRKGAAAVQLNQLTRNRAAASLRRDIAIAKGADTLSRLNRKDEYQGTVGYQGDPRYAPSENAATMRAREERRMALRAKYKQDPTWLSLHDESGARYEPAGQQRIEYESNIKMAEERIEREYDEQQKPLPAGWADYVDQQSGKTYYVSPSGASTWYKPVERPMPLLPVYNPPQRSDPSTWKRPNGGMRMVGSRPSNPSTGYSGPSTWERPNGGMRMVGSRR